MFLSCDEKTISTEATIITMDDQAEADIWSNEDFSISATFTLVLLFGSWRANIPL